MKLMAALQVGSGDVVSFVGGGGKTSLCLRLACEAAGAGLRAVFTTTTRIFPPPIPWGLSLPDANPACVVGEERGDGKLGGIDRGAVAALAGPGVLVAVEADGSAGRPLKFPLAHEPVIPACTTVVVPVAGASVIGKPLTPAWVHRAAEAAQFAGVRVVTPVVVARILWHEASQGRPAGSRVIPVVNQADCPEGLAGARAVGQALLAMGAPMVLLTAAQNVDAPVVEVMQREGLGHGRPRSGKGRR